MNKKLKITSFILAISILFSACSSTKPAQENNSNIAEEVHFETTVSNEGEAIEGGVFREAIVSASPFPGILNADLYITGMDNELMVKTMNGAFPLGEDFKMTGEGPIKFDIDLENKKVTLKIDENYRWNDGTYVTAKDLEYHYYLVGHKDYEGQRYDDQIRGVKGIVEYNKGEADTIEGLKILDEKTLEISFNRLGPGIYWGEGLPTEPIPYEQLKDVPINKLIESDEVRKHPLSSGPFYVANIVPGQSVEFLPNEYYWKGKPKLDKYIIEVVQPTTLVETIKSGKYDLVKINNDIYNEVKDLDNIDLVGKLGLYLAFTGFKLGKFDKSAGHIISDPNAKMANVNLRKAMGHAIDLDAVNTQFFKGLSPRAKTNIIPVFSFHNKDLEGFNYDVEKANQLLDEAGYIDIDNDGLREDPKGEKLEINFLAMSGGDVAEPLANYFVGCWKEIGLDVKFVDGRLHEVNGFYEKLINDEPGIDVFSAARGVASLPNPDSAFGKTAEFNLSRHTDDEMEKLVNDIASEKALDPDFQKEAFDKFEKYALEVAPIIPQRLRYDVFAVSKRVKFMDINIGFENSTFDMSEVQLLTNDTIKATN